MMTEQTDAKYSIEIRLLDKAMPVSKQILQDLKGAARGKLLARMKKEALDCPVKGKTVSFVECFACKNFLRRVKGSVGCRGGAIDRAMDLATDEQSTIRKSKKIAVTNANS
jgi:hypothetical protein